MAESAETTVTHDLSFVTVIDKALLGYHIALVAPHGDVALLELNPDASNPYVYDFLKCENLWKEGECEGFLNRNAASGYRVLPGATDAFTQKGPLWSPRFEARFVLEKSSQARTYSYRLQQGSKKPLISQDYSPIVLMFGHPSSVLLLSEHTAETAPARGSSSYVVIGPEGSKKMIKKLNELGISGHRLAMLVSQGRMGGPFHALVRLPERSEMWEYALLSTKDSPEVIQQHLAEQGAMGFRPVAAVPDNLILERPTQGDAKPYSFRLVSMHDRQPFSAEIAKHLADGFELRMLVALRLRLPHFITFGDVAYESSPVVILEKHD
ncbi:MAG TPA: hypothetical protein VLV89_11275 [Candidatus Acidoferrum sp.]|nr:hypothetical protein [Candidatus Acidoferrum sp.]